MKASSFEALTMEFNLDALNPETPYVGLISEQNT